MKRKTIYTIEKLKELDGLPIYCEWGFSGEWGIVNAENWTISFRDEIVDISEVYEIATIYYYEKLNNIGRR